MKDQQSETSPQCFVYKNLYSDYDKSIQIPDIFFLPFLVN